MTTEELKAGDVVILKSGSPPMTITSIKPDGLEALCEWQVDGEPHRIYYPLVSLQAHVPAEQVGGRTTDWIGVSTEETENTNS